MERLIWKKCKSVLIGLSQTQSHYILNIVMLS